AEARRERPRRRERPFEVEIGADVLAVADLTVERARLHGAQAEPRAQPLRELAREAQPQLVALDEEADGVRVQQTEQSDVDRRQLRALPEGKAHRVVRRGV